MGTFYLLILVMLAVSFGVSMTFRSRFAKYSQIPLDAGLTGREVAEQMLRDYNVYNVKVVSGEGLLSDHYNPSTRTVSLSPDVYSGRSIASAAVAAHECGHAVQHATAYSWLKLRSALVPIVQITSNLTQFVLLIGIVLLFFIQNPYVLLAGVLMLAASTLFAFITLPVEYDASHRALKWLDTKGLARGEEHGMAKDALKWAARTYLVAALSSLATLIYYASFLFGGRSEE